MNDQGNKTKIRVIIAEDQEDIRMALQAYVSLDPQLECLNVFSDGLSAWDWISKTNQMVAPNETNKKNL